MDRFMDGFLWGLGFATACLVVAPVYLVLYRYALKQLTGLHDLLNEKKPTRSSGLRVILSRFEPTEDGLRVLGELRNTGKDTWSDVRINVDFLGEDGVFLEQDYDTVYGAIEPEETKRFTFEFEPDRPPERIELRVGDAEHVKPDED